MIAQEKYENGYVLPPGAIYKPRVSKGNKEGIFKIVNDNDSESFQLFDMCSKETK